MKCFRHTQETLRLFVGDDCLASLQTELQRLGSRRVIIFSGATLARLGHVERLAGALGHLHAGSYTRIKAHSPYPAVLDAVAALEAAQADAILVLGGGSAVVTARAASIFLGEKRPLDDICTRRLPDGTYHSPRLVARKLPLVLAPTTPNSAYVKAAAGVFDPASAERKAIFDPQTRARAIFLCSELLMSAPRSLVVGATLDNLVLAAEGLLSPKGDVLSDADLVQAVSLMHRSLLALAGGDDGEDLRLDLALAGILAGRGTDHAPAGACTALGHAIGANFDCDNALAKTALWPYVLAFNGAAARPGLAKLARAIGSATAEPEAVIAAFTALFRALRLPVGLDAFGIGREDLPMIAARAMKDWFMEGNCRRVGNTGELLPVLEAALH